MSKVLKPHMKYGYNNASIFLSFYFITSELLNHLKNLKLIERQLILHQMYNHVRLTYPGFCSHTRNMLDLTYVRECCSYRHYIVTEFFRLIEGEPQNRE